MWSFTHGRISSEHHCNKDATMDEFNPNCFDETHPVTTFMHLTGACESFGRSASRYASKALSIMLRLTVGRHGGSVRGNTTCMKSKSSKTTAASVCVATSPCTLSHAGSKRDIVIMRIRSGKCNVARGLILTLQKNTLRHVLGTGRHHHAK